MSRRTGTLLALGLVLGALAFGASSAMAAGKTALILGSSVSGGSSSIEANDATAQGFTVTVVNDSTWNSMTAAQFAAFQLIIVGDPTCSSEPQAVSQNPTALANAVMARSGGNTIVGNRVLIGTDPVFHATVGGRPDAETLIRDGIAFAGARPGATGLYLDVSCFDEDYDGNGIGDVQDKLLPKLTIDTTPNWTQNQEPPCGGDVSLISNAAQFSTLTSADIRGWGCSVHESFPTFPSDWNPLAIATDTPSHPTCGIDVDSGAARCGEAYLLISGSGIVATAPNLTLTPATATNPVGTTHTVTATVLNSSSNPVSGQLVTFTVTGANAGASGTCNPSDCKTNSLGKVTFTYTGTNAGDDTINASIVFNGSTETATAAKHWTTGGGGSACHVIGVGNFTDVFVGTPFHEGDRLSSDLSKPQVFHFNWNHGAHRFRLTKLTSATCSNDPAFNPGQGQTFDTFTGVGQGTVDGVPGFTVRFVIKDGGESSGGSGVGKDRTHLKVFNSASNLLIAGKGLLSTGNQDVRDGS